ncbi:GGDEF domain-containing response regulator [Ferriphaselus sp. R-1]|uniref:two-component system response regulator n=1 Tax=Ferriphaselus sp. R-1 TaxID=1485544 RepID=UPI00068F4247|nr:GGDEF domain-containing response regulator [Ferriphaselus sp. R-1]
MVVDDLPLNVEILGEALERDYDVFFATSGREALALVESAAPDLILLDVMMPDINGYEVCRLLKENPVTRGIPVIFVTSKTSNRDQELGFQVGAVDYITKPFSLPIVCARVAIHVNLKRAEERLVHLANYDLLTHLPNRSLMIDRLQQGMAQTLRNNSLLAVCFMDLDDFKPINDRYGHDVGDDLLVAVSARLQDAVRAGDTVARIGGDEFVILLSSLRDLNEVEPAVDRILQAVALPFNVQSLELTVSASIGLTIFPLDEADGDALLRHADAAMYEAKQRGRNRFHLYDNKLDHQIQQRYREQERVKEALNHNEFRLYYQPKVSLRTGEVIGMEALLRWQHPKRGVVGPYDFLPLVESTDLIVEVGEWVLDHALEQIRQWQVAGFCIPVSVNIAARQMQQTDFVEHVREILARYPDVPAISIEMEILETAALEISRGAQIIRSSVESLGITFALDDFGTGYSSLAYLKKLPVSTLKVDQSFVRDMLHDSEDQAIIGGIIQLAKVFRRKVVAEGVETAEHAAKLLELGCDFAQGFGIARPMPGEQVLDWIKVWQAEHGTSA